MLLLMKMTKKKKVCLSLRVHAHTHSRKSCYRAGENHYVLAHPYMSKLKIIPSGERASERAWGDWH